MADDTELVPMKLVRRELAERVLLGRMPDAEADRFLAGLEAAIGDAGRALNPSVLQTVTALGESVEELGRFFADRIEHAWTLNPDGTTGLSEVAGLAVAGFFFEALSQAAETLEEL